MSGNATGSQLDGKFCIWFPPRHLTAVQNRLSDGMATHKLRERESCRRDRVGNMYRHRDRGMTDNAASPPNEKRWKESKRQVLGLNLAVYHINEGSCSTEPGDNNQSFGMQICLHFLASASHPHNTTVCHMQVCLHLFTLLMSLVSFHHVRHAQKEGRDIFFASMPALKDTFPFYSHVLLVWSQYNLYRLSVYMYYRVFHKIPVSF